MVACTQTPRGMKTTLLSSSSAGETTGTHSQVDEKNSVYLLANRNRHTLLKGTCMPIICPAKWARVHVGGEKKK